MKRLIEKLMMLSLISVAAVSCAPKEDVPQYDPTLSLKGSVLTIDGNGGDVSAVLTTNVDYKVDIQEGVDWLSYIPTKADAPVDETLKFTVKPFPKSTEASRSAVVTISYTGLKSQVLTVVQTPLARIYMTVTPDNTRFTMEGGVMNVDVQSSVDYVIAVEEGADWIVADPQNPVSGNGTAKFTIEANKVASDRDATVTFSTEGLDPVEIAVHQDAYSSNIGIKSLSDFLEFVEASNVGDYEKHDLSKWVNEEGEICLLCDLDLSGISEWTPIGQSTDLTTIKNRSAVADTVRAFGNHYNSGKGIFNGMNHVISGLKINVGNESDKAYQGFFGPLWNATVKNLIFDETCSITVERDIASTDAYGFVTPSAIASTIENVIVKGSINIKQTLPDGETFRGFYVGAIAGVLCSNKVGDAVIRNCTYEGKSCIVEQIGHGTSNPKTVAAIVGYAVHDTGEGDDRWADAANQHKTMIIGCENKSVIEGSVWRMGGIVGATYNDAYIENCINRGGIFDNYSGGNCRVGGIIGYDQGNSTVTGCENYGNVHSLDTKDTCVGGITSVVAGKGVYKNNKCDNIISGQYTKFKGIFLANVNNAGALFEGNLAKGSWATSYNKGEYSEVIEVTESNFTEYVGKNGKEAPTFSTGVSFWK